MRDQKGFEILFFLSVPVPDNSKYVSYFLFLHVPNSIRILLLFDRVFSRWLKMPTVGFREKESNPRNVANPVLLAGNQSGSVCSSLKIIWPRGLQVSASERALCLHYQPRGLQVSASEGALLSAAYTQHRLASRPPCECEWNSTHVCRRLKIIWPLGLQVNAIEIALMTAADSRSFGLAASRWVGVKENS